MSYVNKKIRVFKEAGDIEVHRKRSDGRMKTYTSATDARAWCDSTEDRRQHILDLIRQGDGKGLSLGKYIPIEAIIDILLANKNLDIKRLQKEIEELKKFIKDNGLHYEEKPISVVEPVRDATDGEARSPGEMDKVRSSGEIGKTHSPDEMGKAGSFDEMGKADQKTTKEPEAEEGVTEGIEDTRPEESVKEGIAGTKPEEGTKETADARGEEKAEEAPLAEVTEKIRPTVATPGAQTSPKSAASESEDGQPGESTITGDTTSPADSSDYETTTEKSSPYRPVSEEEKAAAELLAGKSPEEQLLALKQALADAEAFYNTEHDIAVEAIEQLENIKDIVDGGDGKRKARSTAPSSKRRVSIPSKLNTGSAGTAPSRGYDDGFDSCKQEIETLEREIESMKSTSSPEKDIVQREVQVLKKYCAQLAAIQKENADLKRERDILKDGLASTADDVLKDKFMKLDEITQERDRLKARVQQLENELSSYGNLPEQIDTFKDKSRALDGLRDDESDLRQRLDHLKGLEDEVRKLRDKTATAQSGGDSADREALLAKIRDLERENDNCKCKLKELEILKVERNCLKMRVDDLAKIQHDYEDLLKKTQGFDAMKAECATIKAKYEELKNLETECNELRSKVQRVEELENERRLLMKEIEDCECCMNNQEDEIKKLACHIDCLTQNLDKRQQMLRMPPCMPPIPCMPRPMPIQPMITYQTSPIAPMKEEKVASIKKIVELENRLLVKQEHTKQKINLLQNTVDKFKRELELERQKNSDLINRYTNQSKTVANMKFEMDIVKRENFQDKQKLQNLNITLKNIMGAGSGTPCTCSAKSRTMVKPQYGIPHFHTEVPSVTDDNKYKHNCVMKRGSCSCRGGDISTDSFDIGLGNSSESSLFENIENGERIAEELVEKNLKIEELENEKKCLLKQIKDCDDYITKQVDEMKKLAYYIDCLSKNSYIPRAERNLSTSTIVNEIGQNNGYESQLCASSCICKSIRKLKRKVKKYKMILATKDKYNRILEKRLQSEKKLKDELQEAFTKTMKIYGDLLKKNENYETLKSECELYKAQFQNLAHKVEILEKEKQRFVEDLQKCNIKNQQEKINQVVVGREDTVLPTKNQIKGLENKSHGSTMTLKDKNNQVLLQTLEKEKLARAKLESALKVTTKSDERSKKMLTQARHTIKSITQKLEECEIKRMEIQRENQTKIMKLEKDLGHATVAIKKLQGNLDEAKSANQEDVKLRTLSPQSHVSANDQIKQLKDANEYLSRKSERLTQMYNYLKDVLYEKDKSFDELRNQLLSLKNELDNEQKLREEAEVVLYDAAAAGDSEINELKNLVNQLNQDIYQLHSELDDVMKSSLIKNVKSRIKELEKENFDLKKEVDKLAANLEAVLPGYIDPNELQKLKTQLKKLLMEVNKLNKEIENEKKMRFETTQLLTSQLDRHEKCSNEIKELTRENLALKKKRTQETSEKNDGGNEYSRLSGIEKDKDSQKFDLAPREYDKDPDMVKQLLTSDERDNELHTISANATKEINNLKAQLANANKIIDELHSKLANEPVIQDKLVTVSKPPMTSLPTDENEPLVGKSPTAVRSKQDLEDQNKDHEKKLGSIIKHLEDKLEISKSPRSSKNLIDANKELERLKENLEMEQMRVSELEELWKDSKKEGENLRLKNVVLGEEISKLRKEIQEFKRSKPPESSNDFSVVNEDLEKLKKDLEMEQMRVSELEGLWKDCKNEGEKLKLKNVELEEENSKLREDLEEFKGSKLPESSKDFSDPNEDLERLKKDLEMEQMRVSELEKLWKDSKNEGESLKLKNVELAEENSKLREDIEEIKGLKPPESSKDFSDANEDLERLKKNLETEQMRVSELEELWKDSKNEGEKLKLKNVELEEENSKLRQDLEKFKDDPKQDLKSRVSESEEQLWTTSSNTEENLKLKNSELEDETSKVREEREKLKDQQTPLQDEQRIKELENTVQKQRREIDSLRGERLLPTSTGNEDSDKNQRVKELEERLKQWQNDYDHEIGELRKQIEIYTRKENLPPDCPAHENIINELETSLKTCQNHNDILQKKNNRLVTENAELAKTVATLNTDETDPALPGELNEKSARELIEHLRELQAENESFKTKMIQLELNNDKLRNELEALVGKENQSVEKELERLRDLEKQAVRCQEKYYGLKKRLMKVEIENKNLKKDYIDTLIAKEKLSLQSHEQEKRLRETNKLLRKSQDKRHSLMTRVIQFQVENENLKIQLDSLMSKDLDEHIKNFEETTEILRQRIDELETENEDLRNLLAKYGDDTEQPDENEQPEKRVSTVPSNLPKRRDTENLKLKLVQLELENDYMKQQIEGIKGTDDDSRVVANQINKELHKYDDATNLQSRAAELEAEHEYLKNELDKNEKLKLESSFMEKRLIELEDVVQKLIELNENLKVQNVDLELDNEYLKKQLDRLSHFTERDPAEVTERDSEKYNHLLKRRNDNLEIENKQLKHQLENMGQEQITLEKHTQQKLMDEIEKLMREYDDIKNSSLKRPKGTDDNITEMEERMQEWRQQYEPQLMQLKKNLDKLTRKGGVVHCEELDECKEKLEKLELDNRNMRMALEILLKDKPSLAHVKLVKEVEQLLLRYEEEESQRGINMVDEKKIREIEDQLQECQDVNELLRNEKVLLKSHFQDKRIKELEDEIRKYKFYDFSRKDIDKSLRERKSVVIDIQLMRVTELEEQIRRLQESRDALRIELENCRKEFKNFQQNQFQTKLKAGEIGTEELKTELENLHKVYNVEQKLTSDLEKKLRECENKYDLVIKATKEKKVSFQNTEFLKIYQEYENDIEKLREELLKVNKKSEEQEKKIEELEDQLRKCRDTNNRLKKNITASTHDNDVTRINKDSVDTDKEKHRQNNSKNSTDIDVAKKYQNNKKASSPSDKQAKEPSKINNNLDISRSEIFQLKMKLEVLQEVEKQLTESRSTVENLQYENILLQDNAKRVLELEERLRASHTNYRGVKLELERLRQEKTPIQDKRLEKKITDLEKQLQANKIKNQATDKELERLRQELSSKEAAESQNSILKDEIKTLRQNLILSEKENENLREHISALKLKLNTFVKVGKSLKEEINKLIEVTEDYFRKSTDQEKNIIELQSKIQCLQSGENSFSSTELENKTDVLRKQTKDVMINEGKGDTNEKRMRRLEDTLQKYHDNNEFLKMRIKQLEMEKTNLEEELNKHRKSPGSETQARQIRKLEETLQKYQDNNDSLKTKIVRLEAYYQQQQVGVLQEQLRKYQIDNDGWKLMTVQIKNEIKHLRTEIEGFIEKKENIFRPNLSEEFQSTKQLIDKTTSTYHTIDNLNQSQQMLDNVRENVTEYDKDIHKSTLPTVMVNVEDFPRQTIMLPPIYSTMPLPMYPATMITYGNYYVPHPVITSPYQPIINSADNLQQLSNLTDNFQKTLEESKQVLKSEIQRKTGHFQHVVTEENEEKEERTFILQMTDSSHIVSNTRSDPSCLEYLEVNRNLKIAELNRQILKQQKTKETIGYLQDTIRETMRELEEESQSYKGYRHSHVSVDRSEDATKSNIQISLKKSQIGEHQSKNVVNRHSDDRQPALSISDFDVGNRLEKGNESKCPEDPSTSEQSSHTRPGGRRFDSLKK